MKTAPTIESDELTGYKAFALKAIIPIAAHGEGKTDCVSDQPYTVYLFNEEEKILLPVTTNRVACEQLLLAKQIGDSVHEIFSFARPHVHDSLKRTVLALGGEVVCTVIYKVITDVYYTYLRISKNNELLDIDIKITDGLSMALRCSTPIYVANEVVDKEGIKVTRELLERSLRFGGADQ